MVKNQMESVQWKFVGLKIDATLKKIQDSFKIEYTITYSNPANNQQIVISKESSAAFINLNNSLELFKVDTLSTGSVRSLGVASNGSVLGFLRGLFGENSSSKRLSGIVRVSKL
jgi:hypothetical protein